MYPYVAFIAHAPDAYGGNITTQKLTQAFRRAHPEWILLDEINGLTLFRKPPPGRSQAAIVLPAKMGVVLGTLFPKNLGVSPGNWRPVIDEKCAEEIIETQGRHLMKEYWGAYVAFLTNRDGTAHYILRDCSGKVPCYTITQGDVTIAAANIEDLSCLPLPQFSINARFLAGFIYNAELAQRECALNEIKELLAGECLELTVGRTRQFAIWDPRIISRENVIEDFDDAARRIRTVTQACVDFWASKYDRIVHRLSGGLDSSVILGCLKGSAYRPSVTCIHLSSSGAGEGEREFAQLAADRGGFELLIEPGYSEGARYDERVFRLPRAPKPSVAHLGIAIEPELRNLVPLQARAEAIWDGQGGDHLFFQGRSGFAAVDYAFHRGINGDFLSHVRDAVRLSGSSYWGILQRSIRLGLCRFDWHPENEYVREVPFLNPDVLPSDIIDYIWQPWSEGSSNIPPGKRWQISLLACLIHRHRPVPGLQYADEHHPLFAQPLFELCLRIPVYTLLRGGIDRALERAAFRDCVPESIIQRQSKGGIATTFMSKIRESRPFIRDLLLDGVLVKERVIGRPALESYLTGNRPMSPRVLWPFVSCIAAEVWARKWAAAAWRLS
jgi:asparagine synthase (glutamine-hydrolysing)